jgi:hypothetical protein
MNSPIEMVSYFCTIQLEILKERELQLRKQIADDHIQREFLAHILETLEGRGPDTNTNIVEDLLHTNRRKKT